MAITKRVNKIQAVVATPVKDAETMPPPSSKRRPTPHPVVQNHRGRGRAQIDSKATKDDDEGSGSDEDDSDSDSYEGSVVDRGSKTDRGGRGDSPGESRGVHVGGREGVTGVGEDEDDEEEDDVPSLQEVTHAVSRKADSRKTSAASAKATKRTAADIATASPTKPASRVASTPTTPRAKPASRAGSVTAGKVDHDTPQRVTRARSRSASAAPEAETKGGALSADDLNELGPEYAERIVGMFTKSIDAEQYVYGIRNIPTDGHFVPAGPGFPNSTYVAKDTNTSVRVLGPGRVTRAMFDDDASSVLLCVQLFPDSDKALADAFLAKHTDKGVQIQADRYNTFMVARWLTKGTKFDGYFDGIKGIVGPDPKHALDAYKDLAVGDIVCVEALITRYDCLKGRKTAPSSPTKASPTKLPFKGTSAGSIDPMWRAIFTLSNVYLLRRGSRATAPVAPVGSTAGWNF